jgi:hypothetical protein
MNIIINQIKKYPQEIPGRHHLNLAVNSEEAVKRIMEYNGDKAENGYK